MLLPVLLLYLIPANKKHFDFDSIIILTPCLPTGTQDYSSMREEFHSVSIPTFGS